MRFCLVFLFVHVYGISSEILPWPLERHREMVHQAEKIPLSDYEHFSYPIDCEECIEENFPCGKVLLFIYGSLLNRESAMRTLSAEAMQTYRTAVAFGLKRVFDRHVPTTWRWGSLVRPNDTAMLNVRPCESLAEVVNGVVVEVDALDLAKILVREEGYDLVPVAVILWEAALGEDIPEPFFAYVFMAKNQDYTHSCINPVPGYALAAKEGASQHGADFLLMWMATTFLADGVTTFEQWEKDLAQDQEANCE